MIMVSRICKLASSGHININVSGDAHVSLFLLSDS
jgi:hypothetical protein